MNEIFTYTSEVNIKDIKDRSPNFTEMLEKMRAIHQRKNHDYAKDTDPFSNFRQAAILVSWFKDPLDQLFAGLFGIKLARLAELKGSGKTPNNESVFDSHLDLATYATIWGALELEMQKRIIDSESSL